MNYELGRWGNGGVGEWGRWGNGGVGRRGEGRKKLIADKRS
jgi:hypothetical protein